MLSIIIATIVSMVIGGIWFGPKTLYPVMQREMDMSDTRRDEVMKKFNPPLHFGIVIIGEFLLATMIYFLLKTVDGNLLIIILPIAFVVISNIKTNVFSYLNLKLFMVTEGEKVVSILVMGIIIKLITTF